MKGEREDRKEGRGGGGWRGCWRMGQKAKRVMGWKGEIGEKIEEEG